MQDSVAVVCATCGVQLKPIAAPVAPGAGVALIVWFAFDVTANADAPAGIVQASPNEPVSDPWVRMLTV